MYKKGWNVNSSPNNVSPNERSLMFHPLDNTSHGRCISVWSIPYWGGGGGDGPDGLVRSVGLGLPSLGSSHCWPAGHPWGKPKFPSSCCDTDNPPSKGRIFQGTHHPRDASSKGRNVQEHSFGDTLVRGTSSWHSTNYSLLMYVNSELHMCITTSKCRYCWFSPRFFADSDLNVDYHINLSYTVYCRYI